MWRQIDTVVLQDSKLFFANMSSLGLRERLRATWDWMTQDGALKPIGVGAFMLAAFLGFRYYNRMDGKTVLRIREITSCIDRSVEKAHASRESLVLEQVHVNEGKDITMQYLLVSKLKEKERENNEMVRNPFLPPFEEGLFVQELGPTHRLLLNKFNLYARHLIVVTREFEPQANPLTKEDLKYAFLVCRAVKGFYFFNSGSKAGASQTHKHLQVFPSEAKDLPLFRTILEHCRQLKYQQLHRDHHNPEELAIHRFPPFNFKHGLVLLGSFQDTLSENDKNRKSSSSRSSRDEAIISLKNSTLRAYEKLYRSLITQGEDTEDYNLIGCQHFLLLIPRRKEKAFENLSVNAIGKSHFIEGFMGSVLFKDPILLRKYIEENCQGYQILEDITYPLKE